MQIFESFDEQQTYEFGQQIGREAQPGSVYCLVGNLGTGKTIMAKGLAVGLGIEEDIVSPTFTIVQEYQGRLPFYHFDIYRIMDEDELFEIGWDEYVNGNGVCLVEWADQVPEAIPPEAIWLTIEKDLSTGVAYRKITVSEGRPC